MEHSVGNALIAASGHASLNCIPRANGSAIHASKNANGKRDVEPRSGSPSFVSHCHESGHSLPDLRPAGRRDLPLQPEGLSLLPDVSLRVPGCGGHVNNSGQDGIERRGFALTGKPAPNSATRGTSFPGACGLVECPPGSTADRPQTPASTAREADHLASRLSGKPRRRAAARAGLPAHAHASAQTALAGSLASEPALCPRPTIRVSVVALRVHRLLELVNACPLSMQCEDAWRRIYDGVSALRSDMLWLNDHAHFDGTQANAVPRDEIDVTEALRKHKEKSSKKRRSSDVVICHIKSHGVGVGWVWELESRVGLPPILRGLPQGASCTLPPRLASGQKRGRLAQLPDDFLGRCRLRFMEFVGALRAPQTLIAPGSTFGEQTSNNSSVCAISGFSNSSAVPDMSC